MMRFILLFAIGVFVGLLVHPPQSYGVEPREMLNDPALEARARDISKGLRCLVCANESIDESNAGLARDLRILVRERLLAGDNDDQVIEFVTARYGDYVLLKPPFQLNSLLLWLAPLLIFVMSVLAVFAYYRRQDSAPADQIAENGANDGIIDALLEDADNSGNGEIL
jgi:cytochrome c-type biogenesis protein CcmH